MDLVPFVLIILTSNEPLCDNLVKIIWLFAFPKFLPIVFFTNYRLNIFSSCQQLIEKPGAIDLTDLVKRG